MLNSGAESRKKRSRAKKPPNRSVRIMAEKVVSENAVVKPPKTPPPPTPPPSLVGELNEDGCTPHGFISPSSSFSSLIDLQQKSPDEISLKSQGRPSKPKSTVGEIIQQLQEKIGRLRQVDDFTQKPPYDDLHFVHQQTRYSYDNSIKRRLISKIVELGIVEVFCRVFRSVHTVDYFVVPEEEEEENSPENDDTIKFADDDDPPSTSSSVSVSYNKTSAGKKSRISDSLRNFKTIIAIVWNCADKSPHLCDSLVKNKVVHMLLQDLTSSHLTVAELKDQNRLFIVKGYLTIFSNVLFFQTDSREILREAGAVKTLQPFLKSTWLMVKTKVLILLSYLITENENDILNNSDKNINFMVKMLKIGIDSDKHFSKKYGYWAVEMAAGLNRFAVSDSNKEKIVKNGALPLYVSLLQGSCSTEEQLIATQGLWLLAFNTDCRKQILAEKGAMEALQHLESSSSREEIKRTVHGALWMLKEKTSIHQQRHAKSPSHVTETHHVHLCYHPASKPLVVKLRERLKVNGYKVYMDVDNTAGGCNLDVLAESMNRAAVVILCMSHMYKESPACRTEADYALRLHKPVTAVRMQPRYNPDGWLARTSGSNLALDLSSEDNMDAMLPNLIRELGVRGQMPGSAHHVEVHRPAIHCNGIANSLPTSGPETWRAKDVQQWLTEHELSSVLDKFEGMDGPLLMQSKKMFDRAPEAFYKTLSSELQLNFITMLKFTKALDSLQQKTDEKK